MCEKIMLIDGNSIANRGFYAIPTLSNKDGTPTNAIYGFLNIFLKFYDEENPDSIFIAFDLPAPTFRHELDVNYKGTRKSMPDELRAQFPILKNLLKKMNITLVEKEGFEADDILGTLAKKYENDGCDVVVISGDRDLLQICTDKIKLRIPKTKGGKTDVEDYFAKDIENSLGVTPEEYIDVKALMGDTSDNIPGVPGIGEKTALKIIQQYKNIETAIENTDKITPKKASENLKIYKEQAILSKKLATIVLNVPLDVNASAVTFEEIFNAQAFEEFKKLEFKSFFPRFNHVTSGQSNSLKFDVIIDKARITQTVSELSQKSLVAYKIITNEQGIIGISFSYEVNSAIFVKVDGTNDTIDEKNLLELCKPFFVSQVPKITLDLKKELVILDRFGLDIQNTVFDVMLAGYILNASKDKYEFNDIAYDFLNESYIPQNEFLGKNSQELESIVIDEYCARQSEIIFRAYPVMSRKIEENKQNYLYYNIELPLVYVLKDMEIYGVRVDQSALTAFGDSLDEKIQKFTSDIYDLAGEQFNINSPKQLGVILFEKLGLKGGKKTKTGYSTAADVLEKLADKHEIVSNILEYRSYAKLKSTYVDGLLNVTNKETSKIYSTFNQAVTATGRISSTEPNLQNIPIRTELGRQMRKIFIPSDESYIFCDADYSQIELRILAHMSEDETFINAFKHGQDIHRLTASEVFKTKYENVTHNQRSSAKAVNFGIVYGIGAFSLGRDLGISTAQAQRYIDGYYAKYPKMRGYFNKTIEDARSNGYASTIFNRRRNIPELNSDNFNQRAFGERVAMNMPIQGSAADIIKIAMVNVHKRLRDEGLQSRLILQVHDELLLETKREEADKVTCILREEMENAANLSVPLEVDVKLGESWFDAH